MIPAAMDTRTVIIVMLAQIALLGALALYFGARQGGTRAVGVWGAGLLMVGAGYGGLALRGVLPNILSITVANTLLMAANLLFYRSARMFMGKPVHDPLGVAALAATAILMFVFSEIASHLQARILVVSAIGSFLFMRNALELRGPVPAEVRSSHRFMQAVYWVVAVLLAARFAANLLQPPNPSLMAPSALQSAFFLAVLLISTAGTFGNFWMEVQYLHFELARQAARDSLTGMFNRRSFMLELDREIARVRRGGTVLSLAMFDLDHFKDLNDAHGHQAGDEVLRGIAKSMQATIRQPDILGRYGGEEFVLLMPDTDAEMAMRVCERIRAAVQVSGVEWNGRRLSITISCGVAAFALHGATADALIAAADAALYEAKRAGRNRVLQAAQPRPAPAGAVSDIHATPQESIRSPQ
jgi:diguanylate cyclase (GGDEF)-like protein